MTHRRAREVDTGESVKASTARGDRIHTTSRELQTSTFQGLHASTHHQNSTRRPPRQGRKNENCGGRGKKKARNFGPSTLLGPTLRDSTLRGATFSRFWAPNPSATPPTMPHTTGRSPSGPSDFGAPTLRGPNHRRLTESGLA